MWPFEPTSKGVTEVNGQGICWYTELHMFGSRDLVRTKAANLYVRFILPKAEKGTNGGIGLNIYDVFFE